MFERFSGDRKLLFFDFLSFSMITPSYLDLFLALPVFLSVAPEAVYLLITDLSTMKEKEFTGFISLIIWGVRKLGLFYNQLINKWFEFRLIVIGF